MPSPERDTAIAESTQEAALFTGDVGELPLETRRVLVQLLAGPSIDARRHGKLWPILLRDQFLIRKRLSELFLDLVVDVDLQVTFTRQVTAPDIDAPVLLRRLQLTFLDSVLLLQLRHRLTQADAHEERAVIAIEEIREQLSVYEDRTSTDHAGFFKRVDASIEKMKKHSILHRIRSSDDRYEIAPTLKLLFSPEQIQALSRLYQSMSLQTTSEPSERAARE